MPSFNVVDLRYFSGMLGVVHPFSIFAMWATSGVRTIPRKAQGCIPAQLGDQVQSTLPNHLKSRIIAKMSIHGQINRLEQTANLQKQGFEHFLNPLQLRVKGHFGLRFVLAAFWTSSLAFRLSGFDFFGLLFGFAARFFFRAAHGLLHDIRVRASLVHADQRKNKER